MQSAVLQMQEQVGVDDLSRATWDPVCRGPFWKRVLLRGAGVSVGGTRVGLSVKRPCRKVYRACFVGNDAMRCRPGLQTEGLVSSI